MSWWIYLEKDGESVEVENHSEGGTYAIGGMARAELNVTYNYSPYFRACMPDGIVFIDGKKAREVVSVFSDAIMKLGTDRDEDYWSATPGNAGYALLILLNWAVSNPEAVFRVS